MDYSEKLKIAEDFLVNDGINSALISRMMPSEILKAYDFDDYDKYNDFMDIMAKKYDV